MSMPILVTGASGFIGGRIALELQRHGHFVRAQFRRSEVPPHLDAVERDGGELVRCDLTDRDAAAEVVDGCEGVIHAAAAVRDYGPYDWFERINFRATEDLYGAAENAGCRRFTFISSISVHGFGPHRDSTETGPYYPLISNYQKTKKMAEDMLLARQGAETTVSIVRPGLVYGAGDTTTLKPVFDLLCRGSLPKIAGFASLTCPVYIADLADAVVRAHETADAAGRIYDITSGERVTFNEAVTYAAELLSVPPPRANVPAWAATIAAALFEAPYARFSLPGRPLLTRYLVSQVRHDFHFSIDRARRELGFQPKTDWRTGLRAAVDAYLNDRSVR